MNILVLVGLWAHLAISAPFKEALLAQGLLGSHFGVPGIFRSFDYVIIGGGTAGLTIARRLASNPVLSIAVIEAGDFYEFSNGNLSEVPAFGADFEGKNPTQKNPLIDWYQYTEPQPALGGQTFLCDSGKMIGGSSGRSDLWQIRGTIGAFDKWAEQVNDDSYKFINLLAYFQRSSKFHPPDPATRPSNATAQYNASDWSPSGGPLQVGYPSWVNPVSSWLGLSFRELGLKEISSFMSGTLLGWSWIAENLDPVTQTRSSSEAFLREALEETTNLALYKSTLAKKILFKDGVAIGVEVDSGGLTYKISASKEVIVSAGVFRSPQILMVSGIGPAATLESQGIDVLADRSGVGQNLWDNVLVGPTYSVNILTHNSLSNPAFLAKAVSQYNVNRTGMLTNVGGDVAGFEKIPRNMLQPATYQALEDNFPDDWPHIEYLVLDAYFGDGSGGSIAADPSKQYVAASVGLVATFSRGNVSIRSNDTTINPIVSPNWLSDPRDQDMAIAAFRRGRQLFSTNAIQPIIVAEVYPGANVTTDDQIWAIIQQSANSVYNVVGTNKMGKTDDDKAVVDSKGRVYGVNGLRVVDASIFPFLSSGQPSATVYAVAEKIADDILRHL